MKRKLIASMMKLWNNVIQCGLQKSISLSFPWSTAFYDWVQQRVESWISVFYWWRSIPTIIRVSATASVDLFLMNSSDIMTSLWEQSKPLPNQKIVRDILGNYRFTIQLVLVTPSKKKYFKSISKESQRKHHKLYTSMLCFVLFCFEEELEFTENAVCASTF